MNKQTEALKMAIEALEDMSTIYANLESIIQACKEALEQQEIGDAEIKQMLDDIEYYQKRVVELEQPAQEPLAWLSTNSIANEVIKSCSAPSWQGLSDDEMLDIADKSWEGISPHADTMNFARAIEQALKEKNHG